MRGGAGAQGCVLARGCQRRGDPVARYAPALCPWSGNAFGVGSGRAGYWRPLFSSAELQSRGGPCSCRTEGSARALPPAQPRGTRGPAASAWGRLLFVGRRGATERYSKLMSAPAVQHVFTCAWGGKSRSEHSGEHSFPPGLCVLLVVCFMDRAGPIRLGEGVWVSGVLAVSVLRSHCLGTLVLTFKCIFQIQ